MIGILIVAHGELGNTLINCAQHIMGRKLGNLRAMAVSKQDDPEQVVQAAAALIAELDRGAGVVVLSDIFGGTPCNIATRLLNPGRVEGVSGLNLPMLIRTLTYSHEPLEVVVSKAITGGLEGVMYMLPKTQ
jgi:PTS system mannose-specific IIA component